MKVFAVIALVPLLVGQGNAQLLPCAAGCVNGVLANAASVGCAMNDILCVCGKSTDFTDGIRDCVNQACPAADVAAQQPLAQAAGTDQCKSASAAAAPSTAAPAESQATPLTQQAAASSPTNTATEATSEAAPGTAATSISTPTAQTTEAALSVPSTFSTVTSATSVASQSSVNSAESTMSSTTDSGAASGATATVDTSDSGSSSTGELSTAARAGIGASSGVAAILVCLLGYWLVTRRRKQKAAGMHISQPLPGSGRVYAGNMRQADASLSKTFSPSPMSSKKSNQPVPRAPLPATPPYSPSVASSYDPELDLNARRYEDLTPQTQPRTMI
ncbi:hypothetical protein F5B19DRAFT_281831 [Rostrohypoxylon terebratum]|nr:hypothetical protein F5B19DRAFT_281831 [Rostrohypoxylon terebratum]